MRTIQIDRYGGPEVLVRRELPIPRPARGQVLIRQTHSGINFMDVHTRQGKYHGSRTYPVSLPTTLGIEGAGSIEALGPDVEEWQVGARVAYCLEWGSYADYAVVPAWKVARVPDLLAPERAVAAMFHGLTAHYLAHDIGRLAPGISCAVLAASGGIGQLLLQLGRQCGATVYAVTSNAAKADIARRRGATHCLSYDAGGFADELLRLTAGAGVDVVFDPIGLPTLRDSFRATRRQGLVVNFGAVGGAVTNLNPIELGEHGSLFLTRPRLADHLRDAATVRRRAQDIFGALVSGALTIDISARYTFDDVEQAHQELESRHGIGKPVLVIDAK